MAARWSGTWVELNASRLKGIGAFKRAEPAEAKANKNSNPEVTHDTERDGNLKGMVCTWIHSKEGSD